MKIHKIAHMGILTAAALILFVVEAQIPNPVPLPGIKLGLANVITVYAMFALGPGPTLMILLCRIGLGSIFTGHAVTLLYSLAGGLLCYAAMLVMRRLVTPRQLWVCSAIGAVFHNVGQIAVATAITRTIGVLAYLPFLMISGILAGVFTGICTQLVMARLDRIQGWQQQK